MSKIKVIEKNDTGAYERWELPLVEDVSGAVANAKLDKVSGLLTAEKIERIQAQAYKEAYEAGFAKGHKEGLTAGQGEIQQKAALLSQLLHGLSQPFRDLDESVEQELVQLAVSIARHLVRRELKTDPGEVIGMVREALSALPVASQNVRIFLHPDDVATVREALSGNDTEQNWTLMEDPTLNQGDCRVLSENSEIDGTLERRIAAIVAQIMGGERSADHEPESQDPG
jgi:flagellar assembly protein FliH